ncbi:MAG: NAD-glutamate dehydrogenase domain-containing protein, partial [Chlamydiales bacterium]
DSPRADLKILESYPFHGIKNYTTYISRHRLPYSEIEGKLRIATIHFTEVVERENTPFSEEHKHLSFGFSSSDSEELTQQPLRFSGNGQTPFRKQKSTRVASKLPEHNEIQLEMRIKQELVALLQAKDPNRSEAECIDLINGMDTFFLRKLPKERQLIALEMYSRALNRDHCQYRVLMEENWEEKGIPSVHIVLAWRNVPKHNFLFRLARIVYQHGLVMQRVNATYTNPHKIDSIFLLSFGLHGKDGNAAWDAADMADFLQEVVTLKYFGSLDRIAETFIDTGILRGNLGNFLRASMTFVHQVLVHEDPNLYSPENIEEAFCRHPELTVKLCEAFEHKFHPIRNSIERFEIVRNEFCLLVERLDTGHEYHDTRRKNIFIQGMNFIEHTLKCNFYRSNKTALAFRLDPAYLDHTPFEREKIFPELPFGIFFIKGMHFFGFHIRFRELSRGGLRTIFPQKKERMLAERNTVFTECYNLALTQQKKNKDIPEGGAKGIIFLKPYERLGSETQILEHELQIAGIPAEKIEERLTIFVEEQKLEYLYQTQRSFIKNFLTLINCHEDGTLVSKHIVDYWRKPEYIYLGPDENMHNSMIEWIAFESKKERYKPGVAFISGKPHLGINHKEYGVTSLGVNVYMEVVLRYFGIDPKKEPFTVKMTGGPDGDVAGNQILNLYKYFPDTAKLLALTDISGTIHDPHGLDLSALATLFHEGKSIRHYPPEKLSLGAFLLDRESRRDPTPYAQQTLCWKNKDGNVVADWLSSNEMNALFRNNVHQTKADIFIPCGGRPRTLCNVNYKEFFDKSGEPTAKAIVEGANLYLSPWARHYIEEKGVVIIKDSSANKGGVICSSFEILCGLTLNDEEFAKHKPQIVQEILQRLKLCAFNEAELLLKTHEQTKTPLTELSDEISKRINMFTDQLLHYLDSITLSKNPSDMLMRCFLSYCPPILRNHFQKKLIDEIPENHKKAIIASHIAARLVYARGLSWFPSIVDILPLILESHEIFEIDPLT